VGYKITALHLAVMIRHRLRSQGGATRLKLSLLYNWSFVIYITFSMDMAFLLIFSLVFFSELSKAFPSLSPRTALAFQDKDMSLARKPL